MLPQSIQKAVEESAIRRQAITVSIKPEQRPFLTEMCKMENVPYIVKETEPTKIWVAKHHSDLVCSFVG